MMNHQFVIWLNVRSIVLHPLSAKIQSTMVTKSSSQTQVVFIRPKPLSMSQMDTQNISASSVLTSLLLQPKDLSILKTLNASSSLLRRVTWHWLRPSPIMDCLNHSLLMDGRMFSLTRCQQNVPSHLARSLMNHVSQIGTKLFMQIQSQPNGQSYQPSNLQKKDSAPTFATSATTSTSARQLWLTTSSKLTFVSIVLRRQWK